MVLNAGPGACRTFSIAYNKVIECNFEHVSEGTDWQFIKNRSRLAFLGMVSANACFIFTPPFNYNTKQFTKVSMPREHVKQPIVETWLTRFLTPAANWLDSVRNDGKLPQTPQNELKFSHKSSNAVNTEILFSKSLPVFNFHSHFENLPYVQTIIRAFAFSAVIEFGVNWK